MSRSFDVFTDTLKKICEHGGGHLQYYISGYDGPALLYINFIMKNWRELDEVRDMLADESSKEIFDWHIIHHTANAFYPPDDSLTLFPGKVSWKEFLRMSLEVASRTDLPAIYDGPEPYTETVSNWYLGGYELKNAVELKPGDVVLDCGAFTGNTSIFFASKTGPQGRCFAFEPEPENYARLVENLAKYQAVKTVRAVPLALDEQPGEVQFSADNNGSRISSYGGIKVKSTTIDEFVSSGKIKKLNLIKMDLESGELPALKGATQTIKSLKPDLAISVYHTYYEMISLPKYIKSLVPDYRFYLKQNYYTSVDTILFATA